MNFVEALKSIEETEIHCRQGWPSQNHVRRLLCNHEHGSGCISRRDSGHNRSIRYSQSIQPMDTQLIVDDRRRTVARAHLAGSAQVIGRESGCTRKFEAIWGARDRRTRQLFRAIVRLKLRGEEYSPYRPNALDCDTLVLFMRKIVGLNDRSAIRIGGAGPDEGAPR